MARYSTFIDHKSIHAISHFHKQLQANNNYWYINLIYFISNSYIWWIYSSGLWLWNDNKCWRYSLNVRSVCGFFLQIKLQKLVHISVKHLWNNTRQYWHCIDDISCHRSFLNRYDSIMEWYINPLERRNFNDKSLTVICTTYIVISFACFNHIIVCYPSRKGKTDTYALYTSWRCESAEYITGDIVEKKYFFRIFWKF